VTSGLKVVDSAIKSVFAAEASIRQVAFARPMPYDTGIVLTKAAWLAACPTVVKDC
jgi:hypothetical protein